VQDIVDLSRTRSASWKYFCRASRAIDGAIADITPAIVSCKKGGRHCKHRRFISGGPPRTSKARCRFPWRFRLVATGAPYFDVFLFFLQPGAANEILRYRRFIMEKCKYRQTG